MGLEFRKATELDASERASTLVLWQSRWLWWRRLEPAATSSGDVWASGTRIGAASPSWSKWLRGSGWIGLLLPSAVLRRTPSASLVVGLRRRF